MTQREKIIKRFQAWLRDEYWRWQKTIGELDNLSKFAVYIHPSIKQPAMSKWINGKSLPKGENISRLAARFGPEIYDILEMDRPVTDPQLKYINQVWYDLPEETKNRVSETVERAKARQGGDGQTTSEPKQSVAAPNRN